MVDIGRLPCRLEPRTCNMVWISGSLKKRWKTPSGFMTKLYGLNVLILYSFGNYSRKSWLEKLYSSRKLLYIEKKLHPGSFEDMAHEITFSEGRPSKDVCL